jgi:hypothetical protein
MRRKVTKESLNAFMRELAASAQGPGRVYFTGGATALLLGFREQTIDIDIRLDPEPKGVFEAIAKLKNRLELNVELASPLDFLPATADWKQRSPFIAAIKSLEFYHFDLRLQALAKLERGHAQDLGDVLAFLRGGFVETEQLRACFEEIVPGLLRYPAVDPEQFRRKVEDFLDRFEHGKKI